MKRVDFSFHNDSGEQRDAVQRVTFTCPVDLVGKARISRFKVSQGVFPLCVIPPSPYTYNDAQKHDIDVYGHTPLDLYYAVGRTATDVTYAPVIPGAFKIAGKSEQNIKVTTPVANGLFNCDAFIMHYYFSFEKPQWKKIAGGWKLTNKPMFLYSFNDLNDPAKIDRQVVTKEPPVFMHNPMVELRQEGETIRIDMICIESLANEWNFQTTPYLLLSRTLMKLFGYPLQHYITITSPAYFALAGDTEFYYAYFDYHYNQQLESFIAKGTNNGAFTYDFSCYCVFNLPKDMSQIFPYTAIVVVIDEFNNPGEQIVINAPYSSGVINMSTLSISKLFVVGHTNTERSDFVFVDDSLNQVPLEINLPRQSSLTIRLLFLLKDNSLEPIHIPSSENFFLQLTILDK